MDCGSRIQDGNQSINMSLQGFPYQQWYGKPLIVYKKLFQNINTNK